MKNVDHLVRLQQPRCAQRGRRSGDVGRPARVRRPRPTSRARRSSRTTAALVKPNIMLLMDASGSMARTHMPDEVETLTLPTQRRLQVLAMQRALRQPGATYVLLKRYDGDIRSRPSFNSAPYAGYGAFYAVPDLSVTDLATQFVSYDAATLEVAPPVPDMPRPRITTSIGVRAPSAMRPHPALTPIPARRARRRDGGTGPRWSSAPPNSRTSRSGIRITGRVSASSRARRASHFAAQRHQAGRVHHGPAEGHAFVGCDQSRSLPAARRLQLRPEEPLVQQALLASAGGASPAREGLGPARPLLRRQGRQHQCRHGRDRRGRSDPGAPAELHDHDDRPATGTVRPNPRARGSTAAASSSTASPPARQQHGDPDLPAQRSVLPGGRSGWRLRLDPQGHRQGQRLHRKHLQPRGPVPLDVPDPAPGHQSHEGHHAHDASAPSSTTRRRRRRSHDLADDVHPDVRLQDDRAVRQAQGALGRSTSATKSSSRRSRRRRSPSNGSCRRRSATRRRSRRARSRRASGRPRKQMDDGEVAVGPGHDAVRHGDGPVQARGTCDPPASVPDHRLRPIQRDGACGRRRAPHAESRKPPHRVPHPRRHRPCSMSPASPTSRPCSSAIRARAPPGRAESIGPGPAYVRTTCTDGPLARAYGPVASCTPGHVLPTSGSGRTDTDLRPRRHQPAGGVQRNLYPRLVARRLARLLRLRLHPTAGQQHDRSGVVVRRLLAGNLARLDHGDVQPAAGTDQLRGDAVVALHIGRSQRSGLDHDHLREADRHRWLGRDVHGQPRNEFTLHQDDLHAQHGFQHPGPERVMHSRHRRRRGHDVPEDRRRPVRDRDPGADMHERRYDRNARLLRDDLHVPGGREQPDHPHDRSVVRHAPASPRGLRRAGSTAIARSPPASTTRRRIPRRPRASAIRGRRHRTWW